MFEGQHYDDDLLVSDCAEALELPEFQDVSVREALSDVLTVWNVYKTFLQEGKAASKRGFVGLSFSERGRAHIAVTLLNVGVPVVKSGVTRVIRLKKDTVEKMVGEVNAFETTMDTACQSATVNSAEVFALLRGLQAGVRDQVTIRRNMLGYFAD